MDVERILNELTLEEKTALVSGTDFMHTNPIPRLGVPGLCFADGPHGLRKQRKIRDGGNSDSEPATSFPTAAALACGRNPENARRMGIAIAEECRHYGVNVLLGPGVNIKRNPLCGRNFEYFSEDPLLAGEMGAAVVDGVQSMGVGVSVKHFALNNTENFRVMGNSAASENTMRRIYLKPFERIVKKAKPATLMCAYNRINGAFCSENRWLLTEVLRDEWGFEGLVMSDWGAVRDRVASLKAGLDLEMPGDTAVCRRRILDGIADGSLPPETLDNAVRNVLKLIDKYAGPADPAPIDFEAHHALAAEIASDCAVLMKNNGSLPLSKGEKLHIAGGLFENMRYQGAGSSMINPARLTTPKDAFEARGIVSHPIADCDKILVFAGLTDEYESEGGDRDNMRLPEDQLLLIDEMTAAGKPVVIVLFGGSPVELPFFENVDAILNMYLPGQNGGTAVFKLLFGEKNPCGKLAETWPLRYDDVPGHESFGMGPTEVYSEGTDVGYRYYNAHGIPVRLPFGFGLSYTRFEKTEWKKEGGGYVQTITNVGDRYGGEVAELSLEGGLAGFEKVYLAPGESAAVTIVPEPADEGEYSDELTVSPEPPVLPLTVESRFTDFNKTFMGRIIFKAVMGEADKLGRKAKKLPDGPEKANMLKGAQFMKRILESNSLRLMSMCAGSRLPYNAARGLAELANGRYLRAMRCFLKKIKVPKLPKDE